MVHMNNVVLIQIKTFLAKKLNLAIELVNSAYSDHFFIHIQYNCVTAVQCTAEIIS